MQIYRCPGLRPSLSYIFLKAKHLPKRFARYSAGTLVRGIENNIPAAAKEWKPKAKLERKAKEAMIARAVTDVRERTGMALSLAFRPSV